MAPDQKILGVISKEDQRIEINRRLQAEEARKARELLAMATGSHLTAFRLMNDVISKQIKEVAKNGSGRK